MISRARLDGAAWMKRLIRTYLAKSGYEVRNRNDVALDPAFLELIQHVRPFTMTSAERMYGLYSAIHYIVANRIPGAIVECGVWKGGSMMLVAKTLIELGATDRQLYLYDTFAGMTAPTDRDVSSDNVPAQAQWHKMQRATVNDWCYAAEEEVRRNVLSTGYPPARVTFVKGPVETTIPRTVPEDIALLRLDTDWYESTYHELEHLYPRLVLNGVLILDDYESWQGARAAVDAFVAERNLKILLNRLDYSARIGIKTAPLS